MYRIGLIVLFALLLFSACAPKAIQPSATATEVNTLTVQPSVTPAENTSTPQPSLTPTDLPTATATTMPSLTRTPLAEGRVVIKKTAGLPITRLSVRGRAMEPVDALTT